MRVRRLSLGLAATAAVSSCATGGSWSRMQAEFPEVRANCGLSGTDIERDRGDRRDRRLLRLVFRHRSNMALRARQDGRVACAQLWAEEQGWRLTTEPRGPDR